MRTSAVTDRSTRPPRHSRVCSSTMETILIGRPSVVASNWKSTAQTLFGASAFGRSGAVRGAQAFASAALRHPQALFAPEPLDLLVVHGPALTAGVVIRPAGTPAADGLWRTSRSHCPQRRIRIGRVVAAPARRRCVVRFCPVTRQANRSLTPIVAMRWCNGRPPAFRA